TVGMFELTFLVSGPPTDTLVVAIYRAMTAAGGGEARSLISAMAVVYTVTMLIILIVALRFVNPTQLVARVPDTSDDCVPAAQDRAAPAGGDTGRGGPGVSILGRMSYRPLPVKTSTPGPKILTGVGVL